MNLVKLPESKLEVSSICCGAMQLCALKDGVSVDRILDTYVNEGGRFFDTAHCYSFWLNGMDGMSERLLGKYLKSKFKRHEYVLATKGCHPGSPGYREGLKKYLDQEVLADDIEVSLGRLGLDHIDLYWLHRDDPRISAGEIVEMLNVEVIRGRILAFGASNWTSMRIAESNSYAKEHGLQGFSCSQPQWSLARHNKKPRGKARLEPGVLLDMDEVDYRWHERSNLPVAAYSPTARGYFGKSGEAPTEFVNETSCGRYKRASEVAQRLGVSCNQVALSWLQKKPFPVIPILGSGNPDHLLEGIRAEHVELTAEDLAYISGGEPF